MSQVSHFPAASISIAAQGATGVVVPAQALLVAGTDGTDLRALSVSAAGVLNVSASALPLPSGAATAANQVLEISALDSINLKVPANLTVTATRLLVDGSGVTQPVSAASLPLPTGAATEATLSTLNGKVPANLTVTSTRLLVDGSGVTQPVKEVRSTTGTKNNVSGSASSVTILSSNANRLGATIYNDSSAILYLDLSGGTASSTSFSVFMAPGALYELAGPNIYTGAITGIWASATGAARVTEFA